MLAALKKMGNTKNMILYSFARSFHSRHSGTLSTSAEFTDCTKKENDLGSDLGVRGLEAMTFQNDDSCVFKRMLSNGCKYPMEHGLVFMLTLCARGC
jgi:hypothetical protein